MPAQLERLSAKTRRKYAGRPALLAAGQSRKQPRWAAGRGELSAATVTASGLRRAPISDRPAASKRRHDNLAEIEKVALVTRGRAHRVAETRPVLPSRHRLFRIEIQLRRRLRHRVKRGARLGVQLVVAGPVQRAEARQQREVPIENLPDGTRSLLASSVSTTIATIESHFQMHSESSRISKKNMQRCQ